MRDRVSLEDQGVATEALEVETRSERGYVRSDDRNRGVANPCLRDRDIDRSVV